MCRGGYLDSRCSDAGDAKKTKGAVDLATHQGEREGLEIDGIQPERAQAEALNCQRLRRAWLSEKQPEHLPAVTRSKGERGNPVANGAAAAAITSFPVRREDHC